jgi:GNAT superfamily N-acetyltransferase
VEPVPDVAGALAVFTPSLPDVWELNAVLAAEGADRDMLAPLLAAAERVQGAAGLRHRKLRLSDARLAGGDLAALAGAAGWTLDRDLVMVRRRVPDRITGSGAAVREISTEEIRNPEDRFLMSEPGGGDAAVRRQLLVQHERWERAATAAWQFGIVEDEGVLAWCRVYEHDGVTEIDGVAALAEHRGRGLGRALLEGVLARIPDDRLLFLLADTEDWPKDLYGRLGFDAIGERQGATKLPPGEPS